MRLGFLTLSPLVLLLVTGAHGQGANATLLPPTGFGTVKQIDYLVQPSGALAPVALRVFAISDPNVVRFTGRTPTTLGSLRVGTRSYPIKFPTPSIIRAFTTLADMEAEFPAGVSAEYANPAVRFFHNLATVPPVPAFAVTNLSAMQNWAGGPLEIRLQLPSVADSFSFRTHLYVYRTASVDAIANATVVHAQSVVGLSATIDTITAAAGETLLAEVRCVPGGVLLPTDPLPPANAFPLVPPFVSFFFHIRRAAPANAPVISRQSAAQIVERGTSATFSVTATGEALSYQWRKDGTPLPGATAAALTVAAAQAADEGNYTVTVSNAAGETSSSPATLALRIPTAASAPASRAVIAGAAASFTTTATGTGPLTYQWARNGTPIPGATAATLTLASALPRDAGDYTVTVSGPAGTVTSSAATLTVTPVTRIANLSIRSRVGGSAGLLTVGLTLGGTDTTGAKPLLLRAIGPTLGAFGVDGVLADPRLAILRGANAIAQNDDWAGAPTVATAGSAVGAFALASTTSRDAALLHSADPGGYTVQISGPADTGGVILTEVYDATAPDTFLVSTTRLTNVSALTQVGTDSDILIAGFSIAGAAPKTILLRGIGPTLATFGVADTLADPKLDLFAAGNPTAQSTNDNWSTAENAAAIAAAAARVGAFALPPASRDASLLLTLPPGSYTAQISGVNNTTGHALVEVYEVP